MILKDGIWDKLWWSYGRMKEWYFLALSELWDSGKRATGIWLEEEGWRGVCGVRPGGAFCPFCHVRSHDVRLTAAAQPWCSGWWVRPTWWAFNVEILSILNHSQHFGAFWPGWVGRCIGEECHRIMKSGHSFNVWTKFVPRHRHKVMLLAQQLLGSDVKAPVSSSEFMDYPRFYLFNTPKGTKDIRMHPPRRKTACLVLHRCVLGRCPGPLSTAQGKPSLTTVRRSHCHGFALPSPTLPYIAPIVMRLPNQQCKPQEGDDSIGLLQVVWTVNAFISTRNRSKSSHRAQLITHLLQSL